MALAVIPAFAIKVTTDGKHNLEKAAGKYQGLEIFKKNEKWYLRGEDNGGWDEPITVAKNGFTVEYGTKDTGDDRRFTFDTKLQTMVEIDKDGNIIFPYILKDYCPIGYN